MNVKRLWGAIFAMALAMGFVPGLAFAATDADLQAASTQLSTQASKNLKDCTGVVYTDKQHCGADDDFWQMYYVKGKNTAIQEPAFNLYIDDELVDPSNYTVTYKVSWWEDDQEKSKKVAASELTPSQSPEASSENMSSEYKIIIEAVKGSDYKGTFENDEFSICVTDFYNLGRNMDVQLTKAKDSWHYAINGMNRNYYVIPQAKAKTTLNSLEIIAGAAGKKATTLDPTSYKVTYYKAQKDAIDEGLSPASAAKVGKPLKSMPTTAGSYVMIIEGEKPYYGESSILFDIQDKMGKASVAEVPTQKYTGKEIKPKLTVTYNGEKLVEGTDYKVTYKNNKAKGTAKAIIKGCNKVRTFEYDPAKQKQYENGTADFIVTKNKQRFFAGKKTVKFTIA